MKELQELIDKWKKEVELLSKEYCEKGLSDYKEGTKVQLRLCIRDAELLLNAKAGTDGQEYTKNDGNAV